MQYYFINPGKYLLNKSALTRFLSNYLNSTFCVGTQTQYPKFLLISLSKKFLSFSQVVLSRIYKHFLVPRGNFLDSGLFVKGLCGLIQIE